MFLLIEKDRREDTPRVREVDDEVQAKAYINNHMHSDNCTWIMSVEVKDGKAGSVYYTGPARA